MRWGLTYDGYLGEHERLRLGDSHWSRRVRRAVDSLEPVVLWDRLYLGGGNGNRILPSALERLGPVTIIPNSAALRGGVRVWQLRTPDTHRSLLCAPRAPSTALV